jgi:hypothetical protein
MQMRRRTDSSRIKLWINVKSSNFGQRHGEAGKGGEVYDTKEIFRDLCSTDMRATSCKSLHQGLFSGFVVVFCYLCTYLWACSDRNHALEQALRKDPGLLPCIFFFRSLSLSLWLISLSVPMGLVLTECSWSLFSNPEYGTFLSDWFLRLNYRYQPK